MIVQDSSSQAILLQVERTLQLTLWNGNITRIRKKQVRWIRLTGKICGKSDKSKCWGWPSCGSIADFSAIIIGEVEVLGAVTYNKASAYSVVMF